MQNSNLEEIDLVTEKQTPSISKNSSFEEVIEFSKSCKESFLIEASKGIAETGHCAPMSMNELKEHYYQTYYRRKISSIINPNLNMSWIEYSLAEKQKIMQRLNVMIEDFKIV